MKEVKGSLVAMIVKSIKSNKSKQNEYDSRLSDRAKEFLNQRILSSAWYPHELYKEVFNALCFVEASNIPRIIIEWGRIESSRLFSSIYKISVFKGDIQIVVEKFIRFNKKIFNFGKTHAKVISDNKIIFEYEDFDPSWNNFYYVSGGWLQGFIELCIDKRPDFTFLKKSWKGEGWTQIMLSWSS